MESKMTMTAVSGARSVTVGQKVAGEANLGPEGSPTHGIHMDGCCSGRGGGSSLAQGSPVVTLLYQSIVSDSQVLRLMFRSLRDTLRQFRSVSSAPRLSTCPDTVLHAAAVLAVDCPAF